MKVTFYYVRHGETLFNVIRRMQGFCDSPLTETGVEQARNTASVLRDVPFDIAFSSSSERAVDTAEMICGYHEGLRPVLLKGLKEYDFGTLDGDLIDKNQELIRERQANYDWSDIGGENKERFEKRLFSVMDKMLEGRKDEDTVLMVSHGTFFSRMLEPLFRIDRGEYQKKRRKQGKPMIENCGIAVFTYEDGKYTLEQEPVSADEYRKNMRKRLRFLLVRHGETVFNINNRLQGISDSPLTEKGIRQAQTAQAALKDIPLTKAFCSTAERTRDTAAIILEPHGIRAMPMKALREVDFGSLEGSEFSFDDPDMQVRHHEERWNDLGGETKEMVCRRIHRAFNTIIDSCEDRDTVLVVTHGKYYINVLEVLFGLEREEHIAACRAAGRDVCPNAGIFAFTWNGAFHRLNFMTEPGSFEDPFSKKILFFDIDGTLVDSGAGEVHPPESTLLALEKAQEAGHICMICSGRNDYGLYPYMDLGMDGYVCSDGAHIVIDGHEEFACPIPDDLLRGLFDLVRHYRGNMMAASKERYYADEKNYPFFQRYLAGKETEEGKGLRHLEEYDHTDPVYEVDVDFPDIELERAFEKELDPGLEYISTSASYGRDGGTSGEVTVKGINKGTGILRTVEILGADIANTYGFGDSMNDYSMLKTVNTGVAMGNSAEELFLHADHIAGHIQEDGLYQAMKDLELIG